MKNKQDLTVFLPFFTQCLPALIKKQTTIRIAKILKQNVINIHHLDLKDNLQFTQISGQQLGQAIKSNTTLTALSLRNAALQTDGVNNLIEGFKFNKTIVTWDLGQITDSSLQYLSNFLLENHNVKHLAIGEGIFILKINVLIQSYPLKSRLLDMSQRWTDSSQQKFINALRTNPLNKQIISIQVYGEDLIPHEIVIDHDNIIRFIAEFSIMIVQNRQEYVKRKNMEFQTKELNTQHPDYFNGDNHSQNAFKFSVKTYMSNVIESLLDEALYFLEKERANMVRDQEILKINQEPLNKSILENLFTAEGSITVLARYLIDKINKDQELREQNM